jgi:hypothetical protein
MLMTPTSIFGDTAQIGGSPSSVIRDVALTPNGVLAGHVMDSQGQGSPGAVVIARSNGQDVARGTANAQGYFELNNLHSGVVELITPTSHGIYRVWQGHMAPPAAAQMAMLVPPQVVRGQQMDPYAGAACDPYGGQMSGPACAPCGPCPPPCGPDPCAKSCCGFLANPWVIGGVIAAAIAIPLALSDDDDDDAS